MTVQNRPYLMKMRMGPPEFGRFWASEIDDSNHCGADLILVATIQIVEDDAHRPQGLDVAFGSFDGRTKGPMPVMDKFKVWMALAAELNDDPALPFVQKCIALNAVNASKCVMHERAGRIQPQVNQAQ